MKLSRAAWRVPGRRGTLSFRLRSRRCRIRSDRELYNGAEDHVDADAVLRERHDHAFHHWPAPVLARVHRTTFAVGRRALLDGRDVLSLDHAGEAGVDLVEIGARQIAAHQFSISGSDEPVTEA